MPRQQLLPQSVIKRERRADGDTFATARHIYSRSTATKDEHERRWQMGYAVRHNRLRE